LLLPITPDHLDWHGDKNSYINDKLKPLSLMREGELAIIPKGLNLPKSDAFIFEYETIKDIEDFFNIDSKKIKFKGAFLLDSILALSITKALFDEVNYNIINSFVLDPHRQEEIFDNKNRLWVNDSKATNIDATIEAIKVYKDKFIHLILGGDDKGVDLNDLFKELQKFNLKIYAIGSNTKKVINLAKKYNINALECNFLINALEEINKVHTTKSVALLSPAAASLDQFKSYAQRGDEFKKFVKKI
jgi:UDP-N-acetylmuramoylalanine--D-glutamate ligase